MAQHEVEISEPADHDTDFPFQYGARCHTCGWTSETNEDRAKVEKAAARHVKKPDGK
jgi:hypothetical protein